MRRKRIAVIGAGLALAAAAAGGSAAAFTAGNEENVGGPEADRAIDAALAHLGGGRANAVERDSEDGATWEVEVTTAGGKTVDVRLDASYGVVVVEGDVEGPETADGDD